jgi:hypothetical protein
MSLQPQIKSSLDSLLGAIKAADAQLIAKEMERLDDLLAEGRGVLHPQLAHFLGNRSYAKAALFLQGEATIPAGVCGGRAGRPKEG